MQKLCVGTGWAASLQVRVRHAAPVPAGAAYMKAILAASPPVRHPGHARILCVTRKRTGVFSKRPYSGLPGEKAGQSVSPAHSRARMPHERMGTGGSTTQARACGRKPPRPHPKRLIPFYQAGIAAMAAMDRLRNASRGRPTHPLRAFRGIVFAVY